MSNKRIYIVLTQTGSNFSKLIKFLMKTRYNHASISLNKDLSSLYSFGRRHAYDPFRGAFVQESIYHGTLKRFYKTDSRILELEMEESKYEKIRNYIENVRNHREDYGYDMLGLMFAYVGLKYERKNRYYCSSFVYEALSKADVEVDMGQDGIIQPMDFNSIKNASVIFEGKLYDYPYMYQQQ